MRYLIIGGTTVFGIGLINRLTEKNDTEIVIATKSNEESGFECDRLLWMNLDLRDFESTCSIVKNADADIIFNFAVQDSVGYSWDNPTETVDINVVGTINLLNAIRDYSPDSKVIIGGSGEEYGQVGFDELPVSEEKVPRPNNIYGATKACQTMFAKLYHQAFNLDVVVVRAFYEVSTLQNERFAISSFCRQFAEIEAGKREPVINVGNLNNIRDFTDADDIVNAFLSVAQNGKAGEVYNAAIGQATSLLDIVRILKKITGIDVEIRTDAGRVRPMDAPAVVADVSKIEKDCGWRAEVPIETTVKNMLMFWRERI